MPPIFDNPRGDNDRKLVAPMRLPIQGEEYFHATLPYPFHANGGHPQCASSPLTLRVRPSDGMLFVHSTAAALYWLQWGDYPVYSAKHRHSLGQVTGLTKHIPCSNFTEIDSCWIPTGIKGNTVGEGTFTKGAWGTKVGSAIIQAAFVNTGARARIEHVLGADCKVEAAIPFSDLRRKRIDFTVQRNGAYTTLAVDVIHDKALEENYVAVEFADRSPQEVKEWRRLHS